MNALGWLILGGIAHATGFAVMGAMVYLILRRFSPAAGALAAGASLVIMASVSLIVLGPWPRWWVVTAGQRASRTTGASPALPTSDQGSRSQEKVDLASANEVAGERKLLSPGPGHETTATSAWMSDFLSELRRAATDRNRLHWGWPGWVALGFFVSFGLGVVRLAIGIWSIQRLRAQSRPIEDPELLDATEIIRAELSCSRTVEIRETSVLATPATIGWRRPLLLLPANWREWNEAECRAVLAHELAHVQRGDFLSGMAAQLSLALHFYNPLAHWLAARLRLEQELAADAWGARVSGGREPYLEALARMALRRHSRALTCPAHAFLPSRSTFVRRIEMLRNNRRIRHAPLPTMARMVTVGALSGLGLLVAGLRGPAGLSTAQAQPRPATVTVSNPSAPEVSNLGFLPADAKMFVVVRPRVLLARPDVQRLLNRIKESPAFKGDLPIPPEEVEQLLVFWEGNSVSAEPGRTTVIPSPSGGVVRTSKSQDWHALVKNRHGGPVSEVRHDGQTYFSIARPNAPGWGAYAPDDRTLVFAREDLLRELIEDRKMPATRHSWAEAWNKVVKGQVTAAVETRWLRRRIAQRAQGQPPAAGPALAKLPLETIAPLLEKAQCYVVGIDASRGMTIDLMATARTEDDAKPITSTLQALLTLGKNAVEGLRQDLRGQSATGEAMDWIVSAADSLLGDTRLESSAGLVHLRATSPLDLAQGVKLLAPAIAAANAANRRTISVNHLKLIGLAFFNYESVYNHFPSPVLYGGSNNSIPYSWRVALLPYLEQNELYKQYNFDEPWDGPNNRKLLDKMPAVYSYPDVYGNPARSINAAYFVFNGEAVALGVSERQSKPQIASFTDGLSNTIMAVEAKREIPWTKPEDIPFDAKGALPELGGLGETLGFDVLFADGSVRFISKTIDRTVLKALITRAGGEVLSSDSF